MFASMKHNIRFFAEIRIRCHVISRARGAVPDWVRALPKLIISSFEFVGLLKLITVVIKKSLISIYFCHAKSIID